MPTRIRWSTSASLFLSAGLLACSNPDVRLTVEREGEVRPIVTLCEGTTCRPTIDVFVAANKPSASSVQVGVDFQSDGAKVVTAQWLVAGNFCRSWSIETTGAKADVVAKVSCRGVELTCEGAHCTDLGDCASCEGCERCR